jgi:hypothetical protein
MPNQSDTSPPPGRGPAPAPKRRHRAAVWSLIVLGSVLLVLSMLANWVQREALNTDQVVDTTDEILADEDVQEALSIYTVDQLYANVDVQGAIEERLPDPAKALAAPAAAATRQLALDAEQRALASPEVQALVSSAVRLAHGQFVSLIRDESEYVATTGGEVTLEYGSLVADLAARVGVDPDTISNIQNLVREFSQDLRQRLTTAQAEIDSSRAAIAQVQGGELDTALRQNLQAVRDQAAELRATIASLEKKVKSALQSVPSALQSRLTEVEGRLSDLDGRLSALEDRISVVLKDPRQANVDGLDASLASAQAQVTALLETQAVQTPGELVVIESGQLEGVQTAVRMLRNLGIVLPVLVLLLYVGAIFLAKGWRREALIGAGGGILAATLLLLFALRLLGGSVVDSIASSETVQPAVNSVWETLSDGLRERARFILVIGLAFVGAGLLAGPGRHAVAVRRFLAPYLRDHPAVAYTVVALLFLVWLAFIPGIDNVGQVLVIVLLAVLAVVGVEILRRQTAREFPPELGD